MASSIQYILDRLCQRAAESFLMPLISSNENEKCSPGQCISSSTIHSARKKFSSKHIQLLSNKSGKKAVKKISPYLDAIL